MKSGICFEGRQRTGSGSDRLIAQGTDTLIGSREEDRGGSRALARSFCLIHLSMNHLAFAWGAALM